MSRWGNRLARGVELAAAGGETPDQKEKRKRTAAKRASARMLKADRKRGHIWESKMKRRGKG